MTRVTQQPPRINIVLKNYSSRAEDIILLIDIADNYRLKRQVDTK